MPKLTAPCTLLAVVLALVWTASADAAEVTTLPAGIGIDGGPAFAGDGLVVVEEREMDNEVVLRGADGSFRVLAGPKGFVRSWADHFVVSASADRFSVTQSVPAKGFDWEPYSVRVRRLTLTVGYDVRRRVEVR